MEPATPKLDPMTETALRSLRDIAMPTPVSWMPHTWGWALLALVLFTVLAFVFFAWLRRRRANAYRREALAEMDRIDRLTRDPTTRRQGMEELAIVLKRTALAAWGRPPVAALSGMAWVDFLGEDGKAETGEALAELLDDGEYREPGDPGSVPENQVDTLLAAARGWIEHHHVPA
ncbi:DUF4381 domain-containing protein [Rhizobium sp. S152]|uniref:DUF4381 domain-containing protein n=1 Tax=Rhizobium sp. S152 TaxID=3055038 RepID=UPI0025A9E8D8|nr:DUF4381 domain-containing protein [Rhizobium sp. S152]MDM9627482.1 DUF4381 domain-containing protein [Rhizobium sp. S152]